MDNCRPPLFLQDLVDYLERDLPVEGDLPGIGSVFGVALLNKCESPTLCRRERECDHARERERKKKSTLGDCERDLARGIPGFLPAKVFVEGRKHDARKTPDQVPTKSFA